MNGENGERSKFEGFSLDAEKKILWRSGEIVPLPPKAVEMLIVLVKNRGEVVSKSELLEAVWGDTFVEESVLSNNVYLLRKTLTEIAGVKNLIQTVPRRGYRFGSKSDDSDSEFILVHHVFEQTLIEEVSSDDKIETTNGSATVSINSQLLPSAEQKIANRENQAHTAAKSNTRRTQIYSFGAAALILLTAGFAVWQWNQIAAKTTLAEIKSIAVLPLKPIAANDADKVLSLGLADALITKLAISQKIVVRPTSSITQYAEKDEYNALEAGRAMQVEVVLDGSFQRLDNRLRVSVKLLSVRDGKQIWAGTFNETETDLFKLQDAIATEVAASLTLNLNQQERELILKRYTENVEAYQAYLRGRYLDSQRNARKGNYEKSVTEFEQALKLDANYALAYSGLANAYAHKANISSGSARDELYEKAKSNALKALALDENLAETHAAIGWINRIYDWNWAQSEKHLRRAIELAPNEAANYHLYAFLLITLGRTGEAVENAGKAKELDPVARASSYAFALVCDRRFDEAIKEYNKILGTSPDFTVWRELAGAYLRNGQPNEMIRIYSQTPPEHQDDFSMLVPLTIAYYQSGDFARSEEILRGLEQQAKPEHAVQLAAVYSQIGRKEQAFAALQKAMEIRADRLMWIKSNSYFDSLRDDTRFQELLRKMNLQ